MEKGRKTKVMTIIALVVAIVTMSIGFAVFSNVLTISSSATVKPNADDYVVNIYGVAEELSKEFISNSENFDDLISYLTSKTVSFPNSILAFDATPAIIDNKNFTISNLNATFTAAEQEVWYYFLIKNEGKYSVYIDLANSVVTGNKTCVAGGNTSQELVEEDCDKIYIEPYILSSSNEEINNVTSYEIVSNDYVIGVIDIIFSSDELAADGEFTVNFDDIKLEFSSMEN